MEWFKGMVVFLKWRNKIWFSQSWVVGSAVIASKPTRLATTYFRPCDA